MLITLLESGNVHILDLCANALGNMAADGPECKEKLNANGAAIPLIALLSHREPQVNLWSLEDGTQPISDCVARSANRWCNQPRSRCRNSCAKQAWHDGQRWFQRWPLQQCAPSKVLKGAKRAGMSSLS